MRGAPPPIISREARGSDARLNHIYVNRRVSSRLRQQTVLRHGTDGDSRPSHALHPRTIQPNTCTQNAWPTFVAAPTHSAGHRLSKHRATETARQLTAKSWPCVRRGCERFRRWQKSPRCPRRQQRRRPGSQQRRRRNPDDKAFPPNVALPRNLRRPVGNFVSYSTTLETCHGMWCSSWTPRASRSKEGSSTRLW